MEIQQEADSKFEMILARLESFNYTDIDILNQFYEDSIPLKRQELITELEKKLDYVSKLKIKNENIKSLLLLDLMECKKCGLFPIFKLPICFMCCMESVGKASVYELNNLANYYYDKKKYEYSIFILKNLLKIANNLDIEKKYQYYYSIGNIYKNLNNIEKVLKYYLLSLKNLPIQDGLISPDAHDFKLRIKKKIGLIYYSLKKYDLALPYFKKIDLDNLDEIKLKLKTLVKLKYYLEAHLLIKQLPSSLSEGERLNNIKKIINYNLSSDDTKDIDKFDSLMEKADNAFKLEEFDKSLNFYQDALLAAQDMDLKCQIENILKIIKLIQKKLLKRDLSISRVKEPLISSKSKGLIKKHMRGVSKSVTKPVSENVSSIIQDKLSELTGVQDLDAVAEKTTKLLKSPRSKGGKKLGLKRLSKSIRKIRSHIGGDKLTELNRVQELGDLEGKVAQKGITTLADEDLLHTTHVPIKIDPKERLLGIIKAKQEVKIEYIENFLKIPKEEIIGLIFDLIGSGQIEGNLSDDDSEFILKNE
ncbi:MAG: tol-pal system YbgF family protein [Candidatus Thorarchaeota archaeon]